MRLIFFVCGLLVAATSIAQEPKPPAANAQPGTAATESGAKQSNNDVKTGNEIEPAVASELDQATEAYVAAKQQATERMLGAFDEVEKRLTADKKLKADEKLKALDLLKQERGVFQQSAELPKNTLLKSAVSDYRSKMMAAKSKCEKAFETAANAYIQQNDTPRAKLVIAQKNRLFSPMPTANVGPSAETSPVAASSPAPKVEDPFAEGGWVSLFNGKNLNGWKHLGNPDHRWRVEDGLIVGSGSGAPLSVLAKPCPGVNDFHLRADVMCPRGERSGLAVLLEDKTSGPSFYAVTLGATPKLIGNICYVPNPGGWGAPLASAARPASIMPGEWILYEVVKQGPKLVVSLNSTPITQCELKNTPAEPECVGLICSWQGEMVKCRKIELRKLTKK